jgi:hypothetical protein
MPTPNRAAAPAGAYDFQQKKFESLSRFDLLLFYSIWSSF